MATVLLHTLHAAIVVVGAIVVLVLVRPAPDQRRAASLRRAAARGTLVEQARARALAELGLGSAPARSNQSTALIIAAIATLVAAGVHAAVGPEHFREGLRFGLFFVALSVGQIVLAAVLLRRPSRGVANLAVALSVATIVVWALTRTVGLPFGLAEVEPVGLADAVASVAEVVTAIAASWWLARTVTKPDPIRTSLVTAS
jgi:hypothetical protein